MEIALNADNFNLIMKACKPFVAKDDIRPIHTQIELTCDGETVTAVALDGASLIRLTVPCESKSDTGKMIVPLMKPVGKTVPYVILSDTDKEITVNTGESSQTFRKVAGEFLDHARVFPQSDPKEVFWFNPKRLATALSVFSGDWVKIEYHDNYKGIVLSDHTTKKALVLPVRDPNKR